ncbi:hypothetical protein ACU4GD_03070 [Cupriavidus basilensis]
MACRFFLGLTEAANYSRLRQDRRACGFRPASAPWPPGIFNAGTNVGAP